MPPEPEKLEKEIETMTMNGWHLAQITSGGDGSGQDNITSWVYLLFAHEKSG